MAAGLTACACLGLLVTGSATGDSVSQLQSQLGNRKSQLNDATQREVTIVGRIATLDKEVEQLSSQIAFVQAREANARERLASYRAKLAAAQLAIGRERRHLRHIRHLLKHARWILAAELRDQYEQPQPSLVTVIISSSGFQQLLDSLQYISDVKGHEQRIITATRTARGHAQTAAARLTALRRSDAAAAGDAQTQTNALTGMAALLDSRQSALADARAAQAVALAATKAHGAQLKVAIATIQKQVAAAQQAEQTIAYGGGNGLGGNAGWAIPYPIVLCESGGQDLPPNRAGASGYYQIIPSTWREFGGSGAAAWLAPKSEQDAVATRIWNGGAGASNWACSAIVGIT